MSTGTKPASRSLPPTNGFFSYRIAPQTRLLRLPVRCGTNRLRRLWNACFPARA